MKAVINAIQTKNIDSLKEKAVKLLLEEGADPNRLNKAGIAPIHIASIKPDILPILVQHGGNIMLKDKTSKKTPLFFAVDGNCVECVKYILSQNANPNKKSSDGRIPLHDAAERGSLEICEALINAGADVNAENWRKVTPLHLAAEFGRIDVADLLLEKNAQIDAQDFEGFTPLHRAAKCNRRDIVQLLIANKANHMLLNNDGLRPYDIAPVPLNQELQEFIINKFMEKTRDPDEPRYYDPTKCVFCTSNDPVVTYRPCPHIRLCDTCYINHKDLLKECPICGKSLKRVAVENPPKEPEPIEEEEIPEPPVKEIKKKEEEDNHEEEEENSNNDAQAEASTEAASNESDV